MLIRVQEKQEIEVLSNSILLFVVIVKFIILSAFLACYLKDLIACYFAAQVNYTQPCFILFQDRNDLAI
ncbi:MAG: hypothetical protein CSA34_06465 [Desulfobulbus propionicus]|nr:MAG: hypothetical protein CSA34_06465 [Desulfobulbus propionicus]